MRLKDLHRYIKEKQGASMSEILAESQMEPPVIEGMLQTLIAKGRIELLESQPESNCGGCDHRQGCAFSGGSDKVCADPLEYYAPTNLERD